MKSFFRFLLFLSFSSLYLFGEMPITPTRPRLPELVESSNTIEYQLKVLDQIIETTQKSLEGQHSLKNLIIEYQTLQQQYLKNDQDREMLFRMVKTAHHVLEGIKENHLLHLFHGDFLSELTLFSQIAAKKGIPKP